MNIDLKYASFWRRLGAGSVDFLLGLVFLALTGWVASLSRTLAYVLLPLIWATMICYAFVLHATLGATLGKLVFRIRVTDVKGKQISWKQSFARSSVDLTAGGYWLAVVIPITFALSPDVFQGQGYGDLFQVIKPQLPSSLETVDMFMALWALSEFFTMMLNTKRRAIHDFIGGTVVVNWQGGSNPTFQKASLSPAELQR